MRVVIFSVVALLIGFFIGSLAYPLNGLSSFNPFDPKYAIIWSGVLGATIAAVVSLCGVLAANKSSLERLQKQHQHDAAEAVAQREHDAKQKDEDRKAAIRREVYTKGVEEAHAVLAAIGGMPDRPLSKAAEDVDALQQFLKANAKVWLVAESKAAHLSRDLTSLMSELYLKTLQASYPLRVAMESVRELERRLAHAESELRRIEAKLIELKETGANFEERDRVAMSLQDTSNWIGTLKSERDREMSLLRPSRMKHAKELFGDMRRVQEQIVLLVCSLRNELSLPADEDRFLSQLADMEQRAMAVINRAFQGAA